MSVLLENLKQTIDFWSQTAEIIFVLGPERSGTSMVYSSLVQLPNVKVPEKATLETFVFVNTHLLCKDKDPRLYTLKQYVGGHERFKRLQDYLASKFSEQYQALRAINDEDWQRSSADLWQQFELAHFVRAFFFYAWTTNPTQRLLEKTPAHLRYPERINATFPQAKVVGIFRKPVDALASLRKRLKKEIDLGKDEADSSLDWLKMTAENYTRYIAYLETKRQDWIKQKEGFYQLSYTEYTHNHEQVMAGLLAYIGHEANEKIELDSQGQQVATPPWDPLLGKEVAPNTIEVADYLSENDIKVAKKSLSKLPWPWH